MKLLNTGDNPQVGTFFEMLHFFDEEDHRQNGVSFTKVELEQLLLGPSKQGQLQSFLDFATALDLIRPVKKERYSKGEWLSLWQKPYNHDQLVVLFFVKVSRYLKECQFSNDAFWTDCQQIQGADLLIALSWLLLIRPQRMGFGARLDHTFEQLLSNHRVHTAGLTLNSKLGKKSFRKWVQTLGLFDEKYAPMNIFSDSMLEFLHSLEGETDNVRTLLGNHLILFSIENPIIQKLHAQLESHQQTEELTKLDKWTLLSSVSWSLQRTELAKKISLESYVPDGRPANIFDTELATQGENKFGAIKWRLSC